MTLEQVAELYPTLTPDQVAYVHSRGFYRARNATSPPLTDPGQMTEQELDDYRHAHR